MIAPQGGPTYYNRGVPDPRTAPTPNPFNPISAQGGINRPDPLFGWTSPYGPQAPQAGQGQSPGITWPNPGEMPPKDQSPPITPPFPGTNQKPTGTPGPMPFGWPPAGQPTSTSDTVPAWLTPGEAVLNTGAAQIAGRGNIDQLNKTGQAVTGFQMGTGRVPPWVMTHAQNQMAQHPFMQNFSPGQVAQHWMQRRQQGITPPGGAPAGYDGGIGYVPPSSVDPTWQNINLKAPGLNIGALQQLAAQSRMSPQAISGLIQAVAQAAKRKQMQGAAYGAGAAQGQGLASMDYSQGTGGGGY